MGYKSQSDAPRLEHLCPDIIPLIKLRCWEGSQADICISLGTHARCEVINTSAPSTAFPINPEDFWSRFAEKLAAKWNAPDKEPQSAYNDGTSWTRFLTSLLVTLGSDFSCHVETEFRKIDVAFFDRSAPHWEEWAMEAAIEIENGMNWTDEIAKLTLFNAGLKVLIAYDDTPDNVTRVLSRFLEINRSRKYVTANCAWLFIFGPRLLPATRDFVAYKSDGLSITEVTGGTKVIST